MADPIVQSAVAPLLVAAVLTGLIGLGLGRAVGPKIAAAAIPIAFLASCWATIGLPAFPPVSSSQKIVCIVGLGAVAGVILDLIRGNDKIRWIAPLAGAGVIAAWLGWRYFTAPDAAALVTLAALWLAGAAILMGSQEARSYGAAPAVTLLIAAIGVSLIALAGSSASFAQLSGGLAAATGGFLLWNWPKSRFSFGWAGLFGGTGALLSLAAALVLFTSASKLALILILPAFFADRLAAHLPLADRPVFAPFVLAAVCLVPVTLAVLVAYLSGGGSGYG